MSRDSEKKRESNETFRGHAPLKGPTGQGRKKAAPSKGQRAGVPAVDIDLIHERRTAPLPDQEWTFVEVWTRNTIYELDSRLVCIAVVDQGTRKKSRAHALLGARLVGGQRREGESMELSHPFPRPGSEAVFEQMRGRQVRFSQTSAVTRVVLRLRVLSVTGENTLPAWEEITAHSSEIPETDDGEEATLES